MIVDLSCDLGEAEDVEGLASESRIWPLITSANVACGGHAGNAKTMRRAAESCHQLGITFGAHPSYPDRDNFGRTTMAIDPGELQWSLIEQMTALQEIGAAFGVKLVHAKPHGALYNDAHHRRDLAEIIVESVRAVGESVAVVALPDSQIIHAAREAGRPFVTEAFADRRYRSDGSLLPRKEPRSLLLDFDEAAEQAVRLATRGEVVSADEKAIPVTFSTLCIHADMEGAEARLRAIRDALSASGVTFSASVRLP